MIRAISAALLLMFVAGIALAATVELQEGVAAYSGCADCTIQREAPDTNLDGSNGMRLYIYEDVG